MTFNILRDINEANRGFNKNWIYNDTQSCSLAHDYLQKISYSIQDINLEAEGLQINNKSICFIICCVAWIGEAFNWLMKTFKPDVIYGFKISDGRFENAKEYFEAIRSFVLAHPVGTNRHKKYGLDGNYICIDVIPPQNSTVIFLSQHKKLFRHLRYDGMEDGIGDVDFFLKAYSKEYHH